MSDLVKDDRSGGLISPSPLGLSRNQFYTSLDFHKPEQAAKLFKARQLPDKQISELINVPLSFVHVLVHWASVVKEDSGEAREFQRIVWITDKDEYVSSGSMGIDRDFETLWALGILPPWEPPLIATPKSKQLSEGRRFVYMEVDPNDIIKRLEKQQKKGKK